MPPRKKQAKEAKAKDEGYSEKKYWEKRYQEKAGYHEWYCNFENLKPLLEEIIVENDSVLEIGCGDSPLLTGLLSSGHSGELHGIHIYIHVYIYIYIYMCLYMYIYVYIYT
jgi:hypothetical protein